jgi:cobalt-zinc-cadmium efflux system protein
MRPAARPRIAPFSTHNHDDSEDKSATDSRSTRKLAVVAIINFVGFVVELAGGFLFGSVVLISDAVHMLFDMLAYVMAFGASYTPQLFCKEPNKIPPR